MRRLLSLALLTACSTSGDESDRPSTGIRLTVEYESLLDVRAIDVFGQFADGMSLDKSSHDVPLSLDPPGLRQVEMIIGIEKLGAISVRADGLDTEGTILGSGRADVTVVAGELAPVRIILGTPVVCGDGGISSGVEQCDDGNALAGDGCSPTCTVEPGWQCSAGVCTRCGNGRVEPGEACDDSNSVAGDGCSELCQLEGDITHAFELEQLETQTTTSATWVAVPGTTLTFVPNAPSETWVVFASGKLRSTDATEFAAEMRLMIDGVESDHFGHQTTGATDNWAGFVTFDRLVPAAQASVHLEFRAELGTTEADDLRLVAMRVPAAADLQYFEADEVLEGALNRGDLGTLRFSPSFSGDYFVFAKLNHSELPSIDTVRSWLEHDSGARHPNDRNGSTFSNGRGSWAPIFVAFSQNLDAREHAFTLRGSSSASVNTAWWDPAWDHRFPLTIASTGTITPAGYSIAVTFDHASLVAEGRSNADGSDVRIEQAGTELDRVLDPESSWNQPDTTIWFRSIAEIAAGGADAYYLYVGNPNAGTPPEDPALVFPLFDDFDGTALDPALWTVEGDIELNGGELTVSPQTRVRQQGAYLENTLWEVKSRLSVPVGFRMTWLGGAGETQSMSWFSDGGDHHGETNGFLTHFDADTPTDFHIWRIARESGVLVHFAQDNDLIATHEVVPRGRLVPYLANETDGATIHYDWLRIRSFVSPEPELGFGEMESIRGGEPSSWSHRKIMAFRADAFDTSEYAESLDADTTTSTVFEAKTELTSTAPPAPRSYLSIQSMRISGVNSADARKAGELRADGAPLLATSHKITRTSEDISGYHHVAGTVDLRSAEKPVLYQNGFYSPDGISVRAAESVIILLRLPP